MTAQDERAAVVAAELHKAKLQAIKDADNSGWWPTIATLLGMGCIHAEFGFEAASWLSLGALAGMLFFLWEAGRNSRIELQATERWAADFLSRGDHITGGE